MAVGDAYSCVGGCEVEDGVAEDVAPDAEAEFRGKGGEERGLWLCLRGGLEGERGLGYVEAGGGEGRRALLERFGFFLSELDVSFVLLLLRGGAPSVESAVEGVCCEVDDSIHLYRLWCEKISRYGLEGFD